MDILKQSALIWKELTEYRYSLVYGYKQQLHPINLTFSLEDYPHLAGFQYLKDISLPNYTSTKMVDRILENKIAYNHIQAGKKFETMVKPRLKALIHIKNSLENDFSLYSYMPKMYPFYTSIQADYLISSHVGIDSFIFIIYTSSGRNAKCDFLCCSAFEQGDRNYETNQRSRIILKKERLHIASGVKTVFFDRIQHKE